MEFSRIFVLGAGAIGSVYGAFLSQKRKVTLVGSKSHVEVIQDRGLRLTGDLDQEFILSASVRIDEIPSNSLILLTTKAHDTTRAINNVKVKLKNDSILLILQNGLGNEKIVKALVGNRIKVLRGITMMASEFIEPGKIRFWKGMTIIEKNGVSEDIKLLFNECGLETCISDNIRDQIWDKLVLNCILGPLTAILRVRNHKVGSETLRWVRSQIFMECTNIGEVEGVDLKTNLKEIDLKISKYTNYSSMYQDITKGRKTEIDFLNGMIVKLGEKHRIPTPVNQTLKYLIEFLEENPVEVGR